MAQRKGVRRGSDRHAGTSSSSKSYGPPGSSSRASAPTHSPDRGSHTVGPTEHYQDRIQNIAAQNQRTRDLRNRASNQGFHQFLTPRDQVAKKTLGMRLSGLGGLFGALGRGALGFFGGLPGKALSGIMTAKNWAGNQGSNLWSGVKEFGARDEEGNPLYPTWESFANRNKVQAIEPIAQDPDLYTDQMKEFRMRNPLDLTNTLPNNLTNNMGVNQNVPSNQELLNFQPYKDGGRIGYRTAGPVLGDDEASENIFEFMQDQNIPFGEMVSNPHPLDALNDFSLEIFNKPYDQLNDEERGILHDLANEQAMGEQDQGIASLV